MQIVEFTGESLRFVENVPSAAPTEGFVWLFVERETLPLHWPALQQAAQQIGGSHILDLHCSDLANVNHPSHYDYTSVYDLVIFRRLATTQEAAAGLDNGNGNSSAPQPSVGHAHELHSAFDRIRSLAVGFVVFDNLLISVHPRGYPAAKQVIKRLSDEAKLGVDGAYVRNRLPASPADLALRMINDMVDSYLEIRKDLSMQIKRWQAELLKTNAPFPYWNALMEARSQLHLLEDLCDEQHDAMQEWLDSLREQPLESFHPVREQALLRRDHLTARARDVAEHIDRVVTHAQRLEQTAETAVQIHFSAQGNRTNDIMRVLTTLTAIFLPLNLITGIFGMNFKWMPLLEEGIGFWVTIGTMALISSTLGMWFWRKRFLETM